MPIFFGDVPRYYVTFGEVKVKGVPVPRELPAAYAKMDSLFLLTRKARRMEADAVINVRLWTKRKNSFTLGEAIKFAEFPREGTKANPVQARTTIASD